MDWGVSFCYDEAMSSDFIIRILKNLGSIGKISPEYCRIGIDLSSDYERRNLEESSSISSIISEVGSYSDSEDILSSFFIYAIYECNQGLGFDLYINEKLVSLKTHTSETENWDCFVNFLELGKILFENSQFRYGFYTNEYLEEFSNSETNPCIKDDVYRWLQENGLRSVNYFSEGLANEIGKERIHNSPAYEVQDLENGGMMLVICKDDEGICDDDKTGEVEKHLDLR